LAREHGVTVDLGTTATSGSRRSVLISTGPWSRGRESIWRVSTELSSRISFHGFGLGPAGRQKVGLAPGVAGNAKQFGKPSNSGPLHGGRTRAPSVCKTSLAIRCMNEQAREFCAKSRRNSYAAHKHGESILFFFFFEIPRTHSVPCFQRWRNHSARPPGPLWRHRRRGTRIKVAGASRPWSPPRPATRSDQNYYQTVEGQH